MAYNFVTQDKRLIPIYHDYNQNQNYQGFTFKTVSGRGYAYDKKKNFNQTYVLPNNTVFATVVAARSRIPNPLGVPEQLSFMGHRFVEKSGNEPPYIQIRFFYDAKTSDFPMVDGQLGEYEADILYYCESEPLMVYRADKTLLPLIYDVETETGVFHYEYVQKSTVQISLSTGYMFIWTAAMAASGNGFDGLIKIDENKIRFRDRIVQSRYGGAMYIADVNDTSLKAISDDKEVETLIGKSETAGVSAKGCFLSHIFDDNATQQHPPAETISPGYSATYYISLGRKNIDFAVLTKFYLVNPNTSDIYHIGNRYIYQTLTQTYYCVEVVNESEYSAVTNAQYFAYEVYYHEAES